MVHVLSPVVARSRGPAPLPNPPPALLAEDLLAYGAAAMDTESLLRLLFGDALDPEQLEALLCALARTPNARLELLRHQQLGPRMLAALELARRVALPRPAARAQVRGPSDVVALVGPRCAQDREQLWGVALDDELCVARVYPLCSGSRDATMATAGEIFGPTLSAGCRYVVLLHRHPSGDPAPSPADHASTAALQAPARLLGIGLLDHVILGHRRHTSLLRLGTLPPLHPGYR